VCDECIVTWLCQERFEQAQKAMRAKRELDLAKVKNAEEEKRREVRSFCIISIGVVSGGGAWGGLAPNP